MWPSIRRCCDWAVKALPFVRSPARLRELRHGYERAGIAVRGEPIAYTADGIRVEAVVQLPPGVSPRKDDFALHLPGRPPILPAPLSRVEGQDGQLVVFRCVPPGVAVTATISYRGRYLTELALPHLSREEFLRSLRASEWAVFGLLGAETIAGRTFVGRQCKALLTSGRIECDYALAPLLDERPEVEFRSLRGGEAFSVPARLTHGGYCSRATLVTVVSPRRPTRPGKWRLEWRVGGDRVLARKTIRFISPAAFHRSLRISEGRLLVQEANGSVHPAAQAPPPALGVRVGPTFLVSSTRRGMVGRCQLQVRALLPRGERGRVLLEQEVLLRGGPTPVTPGLVDAAELVRMVALEMSAGDRVLGTIPLRPVPTATFTSEGGFQSPPEYGWSVAAEEEMLERLNRLIEGSA